MLISPKPNLSAQKQPSKEEMKFQYNTRYEDGDISWLDSEMNETFN